MGRIHEYEHKDGYYIRAVRGGAQTTYQVSSEGQQRIQERGWGNGSPIDNRELDDWQAKGWAFTNGSGTALPSQVTPDQPTDRRRGDRNPRVERRRPPSQGQSTDSSYAGNDAAVTVFVIVGLTVVGVAAVVAFVVYFAATIFAAFQVLMLTALIFLPFGLFGGFVATTKNRPFSEGYYWGQLAGPIGFINVVFLPAAYRWQPPTPVERVERGEGVSYERSKKRWEHTSRAVLCPLCRRPTTTYCAHDSIYRCRPCGRVFKWWAAIRVETPTPKKADASPELEPGLLAGKPEPDVQELPLPPARHSGCLVEGLIFVVLLLPLLAVGYYFLINEHTPAKPNSPSPATPTAATNERR